MAGGLRGPEFLPLVLQLPLGGGRGLPHRGQALPHTGAPIRWPAAADVRIWNDFQQFGNTFPGTINPPTHTKTHTNTDLMDLWMGGADEQLRYWNGMDLHCDVLAFDEVACRRLLGATTRPETMLGGCGGGGVPEGRAIREACRQDGAAAHRGPVAAHHRRRVRGAGVGTCPYSPPTRK